MRIVGLSGSPVGTTTRTAMNRVMDKLRGKYPDAEARLIDLAEQHMQFADGRGYVEYEGDTGDVARALMEADAIIIGTPIFQASIPGALKNVFDLLPGQGAYMPSTSPHLVETGDEPSITISFTYYTDATRRDALLHKAHELARRCGIQPSAVGRRPAMDAAVHAGVVSAIGARGMLRRLAGKTADAGNTRFAGVSAST